MGQWTRLAQLTQRTGAGVFGESATLVIGSTSYAVKGEYDAPATREGVDADGSFVVAEPARITLRTEQFDGEAITVRTDTVTVRGTEYTITEVRPDGAGSVVLLLRA